MRELLRRWRGRRLDRLCAEVRVSSRFVAVDGPNGRTRVMLEIFDRRGEIPLGRLYLSSEPLRRFAEAAREAADAVDEYDHRREGE